MKSSSQIQICTWVVIGNFLTTTFLKADFEGPYALTPPEPGIYSGSQLRTNFGQWSVWGFQATVNTSNAPARLVLEVPAHSLYVNGLQFYIRAADSRRISFNCTAVSTYPGAITWLKQPAGAGVSYVELDSGHAGQPQHFEFQVQAGDVFGFRLASGGCVVMPDDPWNHTLTVENFSASVLPILELQSPTVLRWQGLSNVVYTIQSTTNPSGANWTTIGTATSTSTNFFFTNSTVGPAQQFYRVTCP